MTLFIIFCKYFFTLYLYVCPRKKNILVSKQRVSNFITLGKHCQLNITPYTYIVCKQTFLDIYYQIAQYPKNNVSDRIRLGKHGQLADRHKFSFVWRIIKKKKNMASHGRLWGSPKIILLCQSLCQRPGARGGCPSSCGGADIEKDNFLHKQGLSQNYFTQISE